MQENCDQLTHQCKPPWRPPLRRSNTVPTKIYVESAPITNLRRAKFQDRKKQQKLPSRTPQLTTKAVMSLGGRECIQPPHRRVLEDARKAPSLWRDTSHNDSNHGNDRENLGHLRVARLVDELLFSQNALYKRRHSIFKTSPWAQTANGNIKIMIYSTLNPTFVLVTSLK